MVICRDCRHVKQGAKRPGLAAIRPLASDLVRVTPSAGALAAGTDGMSFGALDAPVAAAMPGPKVHEEIASALVPAVRPLL